MPTPNLAQSIALLEKRSQAIHGRLHKYPTARQFFNKTSLIANDLRQKSSRLLAGAGLIGTLLAMPIQPSQAVKETATSTVTNELTNKQNLISKLQDILPHTPSKLSEPGAEVVEKIVSDSLKINVKAYIDGQSLNHHLGFTGFEQHLKRFPGDTLEQHDEIQEAGMAPGLGAFGYFTNDASTFTTKDYLREKYYCVAQTLYLDTWNTDYKYLKEFYKFKKMLMLNPVNGNAVVCDIGDAGPAEWTGKQFGASPEAMQALDLNKGPRKGLVLLLFIDDPDNKVPLGPINY